VDDLKVGDIVKWHLAPGHPRGVITKIEMRICLGGRNKPFATVFWFGKRRISRNTVNFEHLTKVEDRGV